jgi:UDP-2,4-diacetamido-2,4,6-trideoxy-beta-L-altropyranose hydrolase
MRIAFRVDASLQIGTGHFMRCLTLANALKQRGARVRFVSRHMPEYLREMLAANGHEFVLLEGNPTEVASGDIPHAHWLGTSQEVDAQSSIKALSDQTWDWLVVDHYALDSRWESVLRNAARHILVIDDIADRQHDCNLLLDQNLYEDMATRYAGKVPPDCQLLLGPRYALLRDEFRRMREGIKPRAGEGRRVLVFLGGMDAENYTGTVIDALANADLADLHVDVVIGSRHPCRDSIEAKCVQHGFSCHVQTHRMAELMAEADLAIGAGGSATWERCCLGLPTLTICVADNQRNQIAGAASEGLVYAPDLGPELATGLQRHIEALMENGYLRTAISRNGMRGVDGWGVLRVVRQLGCSGIEMRVAREDDSQKLFEWRNHPSIRQVSRNPGMIRWEDHQRWLAAVLADPDRLLLVGEHGDIPVGVVRFDVRDSEAEVSIYLVPGVHHAVRGGDLLQSAERWLAAKQPNVRAIHAEVLGANERSRRLFAEAGYQMESARYWKRLN